MIQMIPILYEDNHFIIINKPAGVHSQPNVSNRNEDDSIYSQLFHQLQNREKKSNLFLRLNHRLDKPVSGLLIFSKSSKGVNRMNQLLKTHHSLQKYYLAIVCGKLVIDELIETKLFKSFPQQGEAEGALTPNSKDQLFAEKFGISKFETLQYFDDSNPRHASKLSLVKIQLITGRKHQIRSQLSQLGHPIYNDYLYGAPFPLHRGDFPLNMIALHSYQLQFQHPIRKEENISVSCSVPSEWRQYFTNGRVFLS